MERIKDILRKCYQYIYIYIWKEHKEKRWGNTYALTSRMKEVEDI